MWTIYDWIKRGKIPTRRIPSGRLRIYPEDCPPDIRFQLWPDWEED